MILIASGMFLWVIYGFIKSDPVIIGTNATGFALNITLLIMKLRYDKIKYRKRWYDESIRRVESSLKCISHVLKLKVFD